MRKNGEVEKKKELEGRRCGRRIKTIRKMGWTTGGGGMEEERF